jgi:tetratricopeptide (TPR) repeat protein
MNLEPSDLSKSTASDPQNDLQRYGNLLINAAKEGADPAVLGPLHYDMAKAHDELGRYADAEVHYRAAAYSFERVDQLEQSAQCWLLAGEVQAQLGLATAQTSFERARDLGAFLNNPQLQAQAYYNLGRLKESQADLSGALIAYQEAMRLITLANDDAAVQALRSEIASSLAYVQIELIVEQALELAEQINRSAENPPTASPGDLEPSFPPRNRGGRGLPGDPEAGRGTSPIRTPPRSRWWRG